MLRKFSSCPRRNVVTFQGMTSMVIPFTPKKKDKKSKFQNSGVRVQAFDEDDNLTLYYRYIEKIWELDYGEKLQVPVFLCKWVKHPDGVEVDEYGFTIIDLNKVGGKDEPRILATMVQQVFYALDPRMRRSTLLFLVNKELLE